MGLSVSNVAPGHTHRPACLDWSLLGRHKLLIIQILQNLPNTRLESLHCIGLARETHLLQTFILHVFLV